MPTKVFGLLATALRSRAGTVTELASITGQDPEAVRGELTRLERFGFVTVTGHEVTYRKPDLSVADITADMLAGFTSHLDQTMADTHQVLESLPGLLQAWEEGNADEHSLHIDVLHGPWAPADMWRLQFSRAIPRVSDVCMPDTSALFQAQQEYESSFWAGKAGEPIQVRLLMSVADATHPAGQDRIRGELDAGVQIRMHPNPPSFFWITDHDTIGIPLDWGQAWPNSVMAVRSAALAHALTALYDRCWNDAVPLDGTDNRPWDGMLRLMAQGMTMEAAALSLGMTPRTGRRRVADAMEHYNATSHFSLGAAWGRTR